MSQKLSYDEAEKIFFANWSNEALDAIGRPDLRKNPYDNIPLFKEQPVGKPEQ